MLNVNADREWSNVLCFERFIVTAHGMDGFNLRLFYCINLYTWSLGDRGSIFTCSQTSRMPSCEHLFMMEEQGFPFHVQIHHGIRVGMGRTLP